MLTYACQQGTGLEKHSPRAWKGIRVLWMEMLRVFNAASYSQHQEAEPTNLVASCETLRAASQSRGKLAPVACSGPDFRDASSSPDPGAFPFHGMEPASPQACMWNGTRASSSLPEKPAPLGSWSLGALLRIWSRGRHCSSHVSHETSSQASPDQNSSETF